MSNGDNGMTVDEASMVLRELEAGHSKGELAEVFATGGGLPGSKKGKLQRAIDVVGEDRAQEILGIDVSGGVKVGEQSTLEGRPVADRVSEEQAAPPPRGQEATLSGFARGNDNDNDDDDGEERAESGGHQYEIRPSVVEDGKWEVYRTTRTDDRLLKSGVDSRGDAIDIARNVADPGERINVLGRDHSFERRITVEDDSGNE